MKENIFEKAESLGFKVCYQTYEKENNLGYIIKERISVIVIPKCDKKTQKYIIADCLAHYLRSEDKDNFCYKVNEYLIDIEYIEDITNLLIDKKIFKKLLDKMSKQELAEYFDVPLFLIEKKKDSVKQKTKKYTK